MKVSLTFHISKFSVVCCIICTISKQPSLEKTADSEQFSRRALPHITDFPPPQGPMLNEQLPIPMGAFPQKYIMLPPHIAECTRLDWTTNDSVNRSWANVPVHTSRLHRSLVIRVRGGEAAYYFISACNYYLTYHRQFITPIRHCE
jgi:hypothetical protein